MPVSDIVEFIRERLAEDEQWALAASAPYPYAVEGTTTPLTGVHWTWVVGEDWTPVTVDPVTDEFVGGSASHPVNLASVEQWPVPPWTLEDGTEIPHSDMPATVANEMVEVLAGPGGHIARHDPARVLREVEAKRRVLARHHEESHVSGPICRGCGFTGDLDEPRNFIHECEELQDLAAAWSDHPSYRSEWSPQ